MVFLNKMFSDILCPHVVYCNTFLAKLFLCCNTARCKGPFSMNFRLVDVVILPDGRMDRKNAALYLGLQVKTLAMYASRGTGPAFIKRGRVFYFRDALDAWLKGPQDVPHRRGPEGARGSDPNKSQHRRRRPH
jgi:hypothetical protein